LDALAYELYREILGEEGWHCNFSLLNFNSHTLFSVVPSLSAKLSSNEESINKYEEEI